MAFTSPVVTLVSLLGRSQYVVSFTGTSIAAATEVEITGLPPVGRILRVQADKTAGTAATLLPILTDASGGSGVSIQWQGATAADPFDEQPVIPTPYYDAAGSLWFKAAPNAGSDNAVSVVFYVLPGWGG